jgi:hypothetical protein
MAKVYKDDRLPYDEREFAGEPSRSYDRLPYNYDREPLENSSVPRDVIGTSTDNDGGGGDEGMGPMDAIQDPPTKPDAPPSGKDDALKPSPDKNFGGQKKDER